MSDGDALAEARFWAQVLVDGHRTVYCPPEWESRCKGYVDARGLGGMITVVPHLWLPDNQIIVVDDNAMEASWRQSLQAMRPRLEPMYPSNFDDVVQQMRRDIIYGSNWWARAQPARQLDYPLDRWADDGGSCE